MSAESVPLTVEQFKKSFSARWVGLRSRFFKLEVLQSFEEPEDPSYQAFKLGNQAEAVRLIRERIEVQKSVYLEAKAKGIELIRVRIVKLPLNAYLKYEIEAYKVSSKFGEQILFLDDAKVKNTPLPIPLADFLLFDNDYVLRYKYTDTGLLLGAEADSDPLSIAKYTEAADRLMEMTIPFEQFIAGKN